MRLFFTDEAGTAPKEPFRVVVSVIVEADRQLAIMESALLDTINRLVPAIYRDDFSYHTTDIFSGKGFDRSVWPLEDRLDLIKAIASIPYAFDAPIAVGFVRSNALQFPSTKKASPSMIEHMIAFGRCIERADHYLRTRTKGMERGHIIAEDLPSMQKILTEGLKVYANGGFTIPAEHLMKDNTHIRFGKTPVDTTVKIDSLVSLNPSFLKKKDALLLQLADACAFVFRRWISRYDHHHDLMMAMLGPTRTALMIDDETWLNGIMPSGVIDHTGYDLEDRMLRRL